MGPSRSIRDRLLLGIREKLARSIVFHEWPTTLKRRDKTKAQGARCSTCSAAMAKEQDRSSTAKTNRRSCVRFVFAVDERSCSFAIAAEQVEHRAPWALVLSRRFSVVGHS